MRVHYFLTAMGIQTWRLRSIAPGEKHILHYQTFKLFSGQQFQGYLLLEINQNFTVTEKKVYNLLTAMLNSIHLQYSVLEKPDDIFSQDQKILIMGQALGKTLLENKSIGVQSKTVVTLHPAEILCDPLVKRRVWYDLQKLLAIR